MSELGGVEALAEVGCRGQQRHRGAARPQPSRPALCSFLPAPPFSAAASSPWTDSTRLEGSEMFGPVSEHRTFRLRWVRVSDVSADLPGPVVLGGHPAEDCLHCGVLRCVSLHLYVV